jgi:hypothetical protein
LMAIVEEKVKPERLKQNDKGAKEKWWQFIRPRPELQKAIAECDRVLVCLFCTPHASFTFLPNKCVFANTLNVFPLETYSAFCTLQSRIHEIWARFFGSSMKDDLRYTPSDCFETFPFPNHWETHPTLESIGKQYYETRATLMVQNNQGLTDTYNRFHDPDETHPDILHLRQLHAQMDRAVLDSYGWTDIPTDCEFRLDYEDDETDDEDPSKRQRKKPWRYRWSEAIHDEVLARLLDLNQKRYEAEILGGKGAASKGKRTKGKPKPEAPTIPGLEA